MHRDIACDVFESPVQRNGYIREDQLTSVKKNGQQSRQSRLQIAPNNFVGPQDSERGLSSEIDAAHEQQSMPDLPSCEEQGHSRTQTADQIPMHQHERDHALHENSLQFVSARLPQSSFLARTEQKNRKCKLSSPKNSKDQSKARSLTEIIKKFIQSLNQDNAKQAKSGKGPARDPKSKLLIVKRFSDRQSESSEASPTLKVNSPPVKSEEESYASEYDSETPSEYSYSDGSDNAAYRAQPQATFGRSSYLNELFFHKYNASQMQQRRLQERFEQVKRQDELVRKDSEQIGALTKRLKRDRVCDKQMFSSMPPKPSRLHVIKKIEVSADKSSRESSIKKNGTRISFKLLGRERAGMMANKDTQPVMLKKVAAATSKLTPYMRAPNSRHGNKDAGGTQQVNQKQQKDWASLTQSKSNAAISQNRHRHADTQTRLRLSQQVLPVINPPTSQQAQQISTNPKPRQQSSLQTQCSLRGPMSGTSQSSHQHVRTLHSNILELRREKMATVTTSNLLSRDIINRASANQSSLLTHQSSSLAQQLQSQKARRA